MGSNDPDIDIKIRTEGDPSGIDKTVKKIEEIGKSAEGVGRKLESVTGLLSKLSAAAGAFFGVETAKKAVEQFAEAERAVQSLGQAVANTGKLTEGYSEELATLASGLQETTAISDEKWLAVFERLTKFGADSSNIKEYAESVKNLAGFLGTDIEEAAFIFGRALGGNFEILHRYGIAVKESATQTEKLADVQRQLAERGAGILEAKAKTLTGQFNGLKLALTDVFEGIGAGIARTGILQDGMRLLTEAFRGLAGILPSTKANVTDLTNRLPGLRDVIAQNAEQVERLAKAYDTAAKSAEDFKSQEDSFEDAETNLKLKRLDWEVSTGQKTRQQADAEGAGIRYDSAQRKAERERQIAESNVGLLRQQQDAATGRSVQADAALKAATAERDRALREVGILPGDVRSDQATELADLERMLAAGKGGKHTWNGEAREEKKKRVAELRAMLAKGEGLTYENLIGTDLGKAEEEFDLASRATADARRGPSRGAHSSAEQQRLIAERLAAEQAARARWDRLTSIPGAIAAVEQARREATAAQANAEAVAQSTTPLIGTQTRRAQGAFLAEQANVFDYAATPGARVRTAARGGLGDQGFGDALQTYGRGNTQMFQEINALLQQLIQRQQVDRRELELVKKKISLDPFR